MLDEEMDEKVDELEVSLETTPVLWEIANAAARPLIYFLTNPAVWDGLKAACCSSRRRWEIFPCPGEDFESFRLVTEVCRPRRTRWPSSRWWRESPRCKMPRRSSNQLPAITIRCSVITCRPLSVRYTNTWIYNLNIKLLLSQFYHSLEDNPRYKD